MATSSKSCAARSFPAEEFIDSGACAQVFYKFIDGANWVVKVPFDKRRAAVVAEAELIRDLLAENKLAHPGIVKMRFNDLLFLSVFVSAIKIQLTFF